MKRNKPLWGNGSAALTPQASVPLTPSEALAKIAEQSATIAAQATVIRRYERQINRQEITLRAIKDAIHLGFANMQPLKPRPTTKPAKKGPGV